MQNVKTRLQSTPRISEYFKIYGAIPSYEQMAYDKDHPGRLKTFFGRAVIGRFLSVADRLTGTACLPAIFAIEILSLSFLSISRKILIHEKSPHETRAQVLKYIEVYDCAPIAAIKYVEGLYFNETNFAGRSAELGIGDGKFSLLHFHGRLFDYGLEYAPKVMATNHLTHWKTKLVADMANMPFPDGHIQTAASVHVVDHIPESKLRNCLNEVARALSADGIFSFSGFGTGFPLLPFYSRLLAILGFKTTAESLNVERLKLLNNFNHYDAETWEKILASSGFTIRKFVGFGYFWPSYLMYNLHHFSHKYTARFKPTLFKSSTLRNVYKHLMLEASLLEIEYEKQKLSGGHTISEEQPLFFFIEAAKR